MAGDVLVLADELKCAEMFSSCSVFDVNLTASRDRECQNLLATTIELDDESVIVAAKSCRW